MIKIAVKIYRVKNDEGCGLSKSRAKSNLPHHKKGINMDIEGECDRDFTPSLII